MAGLGAESACWWPAKTSGCPDTGKPAMHPQLRVGTHSGLVRRYHTKQVFPARLASASLNRSLQAAAKDLTMQDHVPSAENYKGSRIVCGWTHLLCQHVTAAQRCDPCSTRYTCSAANVDHTGLIQKAAFIICKPECFVKDYRVCLQEGA